MAARQAAVPMSLRIGSIVVYLPLERCFPHGWGGVEGTEISRELVVGRIFQVVSLPEHEGPMCGYCGLRPLEGGNTTTCYDGFFFALEQIPSCPIPTGFVHLREIDILDLPSLGGVGLYLSNSHRAAEYPGNAESLRLRGIVAKRVYRIAEVPVPGKAITLVGIEGVYYMGLFKCTSHP